MSPQTLDPKCREVVAKASRSFRISCSWDLILAATKILANFGF